MPPSLPTPLGFPPSAAIPTREGPLILTLPLLTNAQFFFVDSSHTRAQDAASHGTLDRPFKTINYAVTRTTAKRADIIVAGPNHTETITAAAGLALNTDGVQVFGMGSWGRRPTITFTTATTASILVTGQGCVLSNFLITLTGVNALANPINVQAADFTLDSCYVLGANATNQAILAVLTNASASGLRVLGNRFLGTSDAGMTTAIRLVGGDRIEIADNEFMGAYGAAVGAIQGLTTLCTNTFIQRNKINNVTAGSTKAMALLTGSTGMISDNRMQILSGTAPITADAMSWVGVNSYANAVATAGTLI